MRGRTRGRGRPPRARRGTITRGGRGKKNVQVIESDEEEPQQEPVPQGIPGIQEPQDENFPPIKIDMEADISQLEAPTFTTINRGPPEPMLRLRWDHKVSLIGEKVLNPMIHCCDQCLKPILIYGRMIPCKHVFCLSCARRGDKSCPKCMEAVTRVEQTGLGTVFMCTHGGTRYGNTGCRRTYLSQRDLQAHINHRHAVGDDSPNKVAVPPPPQAPQPPPGPPQRKIPSSGPQSDPRLIHSISQTEPTSMQYRSQARTNLITVPIQQDHTPQAQPTPTPYHQGVLQVYSGNTGEDLTVQQQAYNITAPPPQYAGYSAPTYYQQPHQYPPQAQVPQYQDPQQQQYWSLQFYR